MDAFIVTKDRAMQLDACVRSIENNAGNLVDKVHILYKASNDDYLNGYLKCFSSIEKRDKLDLYVVNESNFRNDFLSCLKRLEKWTLFCVDDTILFKPVPFIDGQFPHINPSVFCLSLRLGENIMIQDIATGLTMPQPKEVFSYCIGWQNSRPQALLWNWDKESVEFNIGYPISMDGVIYRASDLYTLSTEVDFNDLRSWEGNLVHHVRSDKASIRRPMMASPVNSCAVNIPINMTQPPYLTNVGPYNFSLKDLNNRYLAGEVFDLEKMLDGLDIRSSHCYIKPMFMRSN